MCNGENWALLIVEANVAAKRKMYRGVVSSSSEYAVVTTAASSEFVDCSCQCEIEKCKAACAMRR